jgi:hypothetical protein
MKVKIEYAVLAIVIVALGLYLFLRSTDRTSYTLPEIPTLDTQAITKIEISKGDQTIDLERQDDSWRIAPGDYPADAGKVNRMLDDLADLKVTALVSETRNYERYDLGEDKQIRVTAFQDGKAVRAFQIGKPADTFRHTHITLAEDPNVYHAQGNFRNDFDQSVADLRDKTVMAFKPEDVTEFTVASNGREFTLHKVKTAPSPAEKKDDSAADEEKPSDSEPTWQTADGTSVDNEKVEQLLADVAGLKCRAYLNDQSKSDLSSPAYSIRIQAGSTSVLEVFETEDDTASELPARSSLREEPFTLADFDIDALKNFIADLRGDNEKETAKEDKTASP